MKSTGITRKIDELGRIVIPKEIRKNLNIRDGESLAIYINEDNIILHKHSEVKKLSELASKLTNLIHDIYKIDVIITDREKVITSSISKDYINELLNQELTRLIDNRETYESKEAATISIGNKKIIGYITILPIISSIDSLGLIILVSNSNDSLLSLGKLAVSILTQELNN